MRADGSGRNKPAIIVAAPNEAGYPKVQGRCPACGSTTLFLGSGGYVTCSLLGCSDPCSADKFLHGEGAS